MKKTVKRPKQDFNATNRKKQIKISNLKSLMKVCENVAGIDVGGEFHFVAAPDPKEKNKIIVNRFGCYTRNLKECVELLKNSDIKSVAMEATGVYWVILEKMLRAEGIEVV